MNGIVLHICLLSISSAYIIYKIKL